MKNRKYSWLILALVVLLGASLSFSQDQVDFPLIYIDADTGDAGVGSQADPYNELSDINWTTGGDNSIFDYLAGSPSESPFVYLQRGDNWQETMTAPTSGTATYPIVVTSYGSGASPSITMASTSDTLNVTGDYLQFIGICFIGGRVLINSGDNVDLFYCIFKNHAHTNGMIRYWAADDCRLYNCIVANCWNTGIDVGGSSTNIDIKNTIVVGCAEPNGYGVLEDTEAITYTNCMFIGNNQYPANNVSGGTDGGNNMIATDFPYFTTPYNQNYVCFTIDDIVEADYATAVAAAIAPYKLTWAVNYTANAGFQAEMVALNAAGHEITNHGYNHSDLSKTTLFAVTSTNTNPTVDVDIPGTQIVLSCDEGANIVTQDWSSDETITDLKASVAGKGWTITNTANVQDGTLLSGAADSSGAQTVPYTVNTAIVVGNGYAYWANEVTANNTWINSVTGVTPTTFVYPYVASSAALINFLKDVDGYLGGRGPYGTKLESLTIYKLCTTTLADLKGDGSETTIRRAARHLAAFVMYGGNIVCPLAHSSTDFTVAQWGYLADELRIIGVNVVTLASAVASIRADHATADGLTYTKTYSDLSDFTLNPHSPCVDAGTDVSLTEDYNSVSVPLRGDMGTSKSFINVGGNLYIIPGAATEGNPDIGAYEYIALYKIGIDGYLYLRLTETHYLRMNQPDFLREYK